MYLGIRINIFLLIAEVAGLKEQLAQQLIELIQPEIELGQIYRYHHKLLSTAKPEEAAMVVIQEEFMLLQKPMEYQKKAAKTTQQKILLNSAALQFKNVKIVVIQKDRNQEIKEIVGQPRGILYGKLINMEQFLELIK